MFWLIYLTVEEVFPLGLSQPLLGNNMLVILVAVVLSLHSLFLSFYRRSKLLSQSVNEQKIEVVQQALIVGVALAMSVTIWGLFLAFALHYHYFFLWFIVGIAATIIHFPRRHYLVDASVSVA